jgi:SecD/SecF fusion protein
MGSNQLWKKVLIAVLVVIAVLALFPLEKKLKPGLDLAGGTSLIYGIDTEGMSSDEVRGIASRMVPILMRRIDPTGVTNIVIRPQGDTRIEIQLPLASKDSRIKRDVYQQAYDTLESGNINLATVIKSLSLEPQARQEAFAEFAHNSDQRNILADLASAYDQRKQARDARDQYSALMDEIKGKLTESGVNFRSIERMVNDWAGMDAQELDKALSDYVLSGSEEEGPAELNEEQKTKKQLLNDYVVAYGKWADTVNRLADTLNEDYDNALARISELNINVSAFADMLETAKRQEYIAEVKSDFPDRAENIEKFVAAYDSYSELRGRLDDPEDLKRMLKGAGVLEFRILPTVSDGGLSSDLATAYVENLQARGPKLASDANYQWCQIDDPETFGAGGAVTGTFAEKEYVLASNKPAETMLHGQGGREWKLNKAYPTTDQMGRRAIGFQMNEIGAKMFFELTSNSIEKPLCILLDSRAISAPNVNDAIRSTGIITGSYGAIEQDDMVNKLNAGSLPARISEAPISEKTIGATIGEDYRDQGIRAGFIGLAMVAVFMMFYYRFSGSVAVVALVLNLLFVLAMMAFSGATFTLPGIAGLILTIGMAVDANVLIFERIREEQESGCSLRMAVANGYSKAFRTIFDANLTTFITAMILYMVASEEIKGFAIVLMFGIISSMFTALFVTRVVFDSLIAKKMLKNKLGMFKIFDNPSFNWIGARKVFLTVSVILVVCGLFIFISRDSDKYDIEFTGGTSVQVNFKEGITMERAEVEATIRSMGEKYDSSGLMAAKVYSIGDNNNQFEINTTETNKSSVDITFSEAGQTVQSVRDAVDEAASDNVRNISVKRADKDNTFTIATSQLSDSAVEKLMDRAFEDKQYTISEPRVNEVVNDAVIEAFEDVLQKQENLGLTIESSGMITDEVADEAAELVEYLSGLKIEANLKNPIKGLQLKERFKSLRFKPDMQDMTWYRYVLLGEDYEPLQDDDVVTGFAYISIHPDAGYRQLDADELERFENNEVAKVEAAASLETSLPRVTQVNPSIGSESQTKALIAIILSLFAIIAYVWVRFGDMSFGFAAIAALVHDVCITLGAVAICTYIAGTAVGDMLGIRDFKINLQMIAAFLTIIGYSLNDTIVVFDRIRENRGKNGEITPALLTMSINQTLSRTLLTSFTTFIVVLVMYIWGGIGLRGFTFAMLVGILVGTYSSIAIASPILLIGSGKKEE